MKTPLRLLILEDQPVDAELMVRHLERAGFAPRWGRSWNSSWPITSCRTTTRCGRWRGCANAGCRYRSLSPPGPSAKNWRWRPCSRARRTSSSRTARRWLGPAVKHALEQRRTQEALRHFEELSRRIVAIANELAKMAPHYEQLSTLARELEVTPEQAATVDAADAPVREYIESRLGELLHAFRQFSAQGEAPAAAPNVVDRASHLLAAVQDTLGVLERTKRSFKSRTLGQLRERLEAVLRM